MGMLDRLLYIKYQVEKNLDWSPTDQQLVSMTRNIIKSNLVSAAALGETLSTPTLPTTFLGATVSWASGNTEFTITKGDYSVTQVYNQADAEISVSKG